MQPFDPPSHWHGHQPARTTPAPGENPQYDALEAERKRLCNLEEETLNSLGYHDLRGIGLTAALNAYRARLVQIKIEQADLLSAP
jgi:hypothetical protein